MTTTSHGGPDAPTSKGAPQEGDFPPPLFTTEPPLCPFRRCDMSSNHLVVGRGWDFEYHTTRQEIEMLQCRSCQIIFPRRIPDAATLPVIYPPNYYAFSETVNPNRVVKAVRAWMSRRKGRVYQNLVTAAQADVIDIGCGDGRMLDILRESCPTGWRYAGIDWSDAAVKRVREKGYEGRSGDISRMDLSDWQDRFDLALMHQLIEHVHDPRAVLDKVRGILKPGAILSVETPDIDAWDYRLLRKRYWAGYHIPRHFYIFNKQNFAALAKEVGYEVVSTAALVNPVFWIHSVQSYCADKAFLRRIAGFFHHQNVLMLGLFTPLEILQTRLWGTSSNMQVNLRKLP